MDKTIQINGLFKKKLFVLAPFIKEPWREFTLTEIKKLTKKKSHHYVFEALKGFIKLNLIKEKKKGNTNIYTINVENQEVHYVVLIEHLIKEQRKDIPYKNITKITCRIKSPFYSLIIGGSYAEGRQKPTSDLDIAIIIPDSENKNQYEAALREGELLIPEIHGYIFTKKEFYEMLVNKEFNYGKELARKHILCHGAEPYYEILFEAMRNGFNG
jgi:predicted nucleotidyltransferase